MRTLLLVVLSFGFAFAALDPAEQAILAKMDKVGPTFHGMSAKIKRVSYTAIIKDTSEEAGTFLLKKNSPRDVQVLINFIAPDQKTVAIHNTKVEVYLPKINTVQEYDLGQYRGLVNQYLLLGFGSTGKELAKEYTIKAAAVEKLAGQETTRLNLVAKSPKVLEQFPEIVLWISNDTVAPLQQKLIAPSGDYYMATYQDVQLNPSFPPNALTLQLPKNVVRERPQK